MADMMESHGDELDLTAVVCARNAAHMIRPCLEAAKRNRPARIILVDGGSTDGTRSLAADLVDDVVIDRGKGLARARNMGIDRAETAYIVFVGPDNIMPPGSIKQMIEYLEEKNCAIVSAVTELLDTQSYWGWAQNKYRLAKYTPGYKAVVGTPTLFRTALARRYKYDPMMKNSDDTEICERMARDGHRFAIADTRCLEIGFETFGAIVERWTRYGRGDYLFYENQKRGWTFRRKIRSFLHPFVHDFLVPWEGLKNGDRTGCLPFLMTIVGLRYFGWIKSAIQRNSILKT